MDYTIMDASIEELSTIRHIANLTWPTAYAGIISPEQITFMLGVMYNAEELKSQYDRGVVFKLLNYKEHPVAFTAIEHIVRSEESVLRIQKLYIIPEYQKYGFGKLLLQTAIEYAESKSIPFLELNVNKLNPAVGFYLKNGFYVDYEMVLDIGNGYVMDDYVMKRSVLYIP